MDSRCCLATREDWTLSIWLAPPTLELLETQRRLLEGALATRGRILSFTSFCLDGVDMDEMRYPALKSKFEELALLVDGPMIAHALVIDGSGFPAVFMRAAASALGFLLRAKAPTKAFDSHGPAVRWLAAQRPGGEELGEGAAVETCVARIVSAMRMPS